MPLSLILKPSVTVLVQKLESPVKEAEQKVL